MRNDPAHGGEDFVRLHLYLSQAVEMANPYGGLCIPIKAGFRNENNALHQC